MSEAKKEKEVFGASKKSVGNCGEVKVQRKIKLQISFFELLTVKK